MLDQLIFGHLLDFYAHRKVDTDISHPFTIYEWLNKYLFVLDGIASVILIKIF